MPAPLIRTPTVRVSLRGISAAQREAEWLSRNGHAEHRMNFALLATALKKYSVGRGSIAILDEPVSVDVAERVDDIGKRPGLADPRTSLELSFIRELTGLARAER